MSNGLGRKIGIKFTEDIVGDISEKNMDAFISPKGTFSASNTVVGYPVTNAFDGNINTFWYNYWSGNAQWIQVRLESPTLITGFRWRNVAGYRPKDFKLQGSTDGATWVDIHTATNPNIDGFQEFVFGAVTYEYYRWTFLSYHNSYVQLSELELRVKVGNENAFTVTGEEYQYVNGPLIPKEYKAISVERHPDHTDDKHLLVTLHPQSRFNNIEGSLTVQYDQNQGSLRGRGGPVEGFTETFTPTDLEPKPNPHAAENFKMTAGAVVDLLKVEYNNGYVAENFKITAAATITLTFVGIINP